MAKEASIIWQNQKTHNGVRISERREKTKKRKKEKGTFFVVRVRMQHLSVADRVVDVLHY